MGAAVMDCLLYELEKTVVRGPLDFAVHSLLSCSMLLRSKMALMSVILLE